MFKRILSFILCLALILPMVPIPTRATEATAPEPIETTPETTVFPDETTIPTAPAEILQTEAASAEPAAATTASGTCGDNLTWTLEEGTLTISGSGNMASYAWTTETAPWSDYSAEITKLVIESEVTSIGGDAFSDLVNLTEVTIPSSVQNIGDYAFSGCIALTTLSLPIGVKSIGARAFYGCTGLETIDLPISLTSISYDCFRDCSSLTGIILPSSIESLGDQLFWNCTSLTTAEFKSRISEIPEDTFKNCTSLTTVTLPSSISSIGSSAFHNCTALKSITIPSRVTSLKAVFQNCTSLTEITIPARVTDISGAFSGCTSLTSVKVPSRVTDMAGAFAGCTSLVSVNIPDGVTDISNAFSGCTSLTELDVPDSVTNLEGAFSGCVNLTGSITVPSGTTEISDTTFQNCQKLTGISLPDTVTTIAPNAFENCAGLTEITIPNGVTVLEDEVFAGCTSLKKVVLPDSLTSIGYRCFYECSALTDADLPDKLTEIGSGAFYETGLTGSLVIPEGITIIQNYTFEECKNLTAVTLPEGITSIGGSAFARCERLASINIPQSVTTIGGTAFSHTALTEVILPEGITSIGGSVFHSCTRLVSVSLPDSLEFIGGSAFHGCTSLCSIALPPNLSIIENGTFWDCTGLTEVVIPDKVTRIDDTAFADCFNLKTVTIPASVTTIGEFSFQSCPLTDVYYTGTEAQWAALVEANKNVHVNMLPDGLRNLWEASIHCNYVPGPSAPSGTCGDNLTWTYENGTLTISGSGDMAYYDSPEDFSWHQYRAEITAVSLPEGLTSISYDAFFSCTQLTSIALPSTLTTIGGNAFSFSGLTGTVTIPASVTNIGTGAFQSCASLTAFAVAEANPSYCAIDGVLFSKDGTSLHTYPSGAPAANYSAPNGTTTLENASFMGCHNLTGISLPEGLTTIYGSSFYCDNLTGILLPASLSYVGHYAFLNVPVLSTVFYTGTQEQWQYLAENGIMEGNQSLLATMVRYNWTRPETPETPEAPLGGTCGQNLTWRLENGTLTISGTGPMEGYPWREYASQITAISIGQGVASISDSAFANLNGVTEITFPDSVTLIGARAFQGLQGLTRVEFQNSYALLIGSYAFNSCSQLKTLVLPKACTLISTGAFAYCSSLTDVYFTGTEAEWSDLLQNKVETGNDALKNAPNIVCNYGAVVEPTEPTEPTTPTEPTVPTEPEDEPLLAQGTCGDSASWTLTASGHLTVTGTGAVTAAPWLGSPITYVTVADGITALCDAAFLDCVNLKKVTLPASVTTIGVSAFYGCTALTTAGPLGSGADYEFGWTKEIPANAFTYLKNLSKITFPKGLTTIGNEAFRECAFTKLVVPEGVKTIGNNAFMSCVSIKRLSLPSTLTSTGSFAFANCSSLTDVFVMGKKTAFGSNAFQYCSTITNVFYAISEEKIGNITGNQVLENATNRYCNWTSSLQPSETDIQMYHHSNYQWTDVLEEEAVFCTTARERLSFTIIPGVNMQSDSIAFALEQNGQYIQINTTGLFSDIYVNGYIAPGKPIFAVIMNSSGTVIYRKQLKVSAVESYSITYVIWDKGDIELDRESYTEGILIQEPPHPVRSGYVFEGWYLSNTYAGEDYFSHANRVKRDLQTGNITLYAKWVKHDSKSLVPKIDTWYRFGNFDDHFGTTHRMLPDDYDLLLKDPVTQKKYNGAGRAASEAKEWSGSCCGMSSFVVLAATGYLSINDFTEPDIDCIGDANFWAIKPVGGIESAINYYHLRQMIGKLDDIRQDYDLPYRSSTISDSNNLKKIIEEMQEAQQPVVLNIELQKEKTTGYFDANFDRHSVVAYNLTQINNSTFTFEVYDCSLVKPNYDPGIFTVTVNVVTDQEIYVAECDEWEKRWTGYEDIFFGCTMTAEELLVNPYLSATGTSSTASSSNSAFPLVIETQYDSFTLTNGTQSAVIKNGFVTSGDLPVQCNGSVNYVGGKERYQFEVPMTDVDAEYAITHSETESMRTSFFCDAPDNGFFSSVISAGVGTITISSNGSVTTHFSEDTPQEISVTHNDMTTPWYIVDVSGTSTGFSVTPSTESVSVVSETDTTVSVETSAGINTVTLENVPVSTKEVLIQENGNKECVVTQDQEVIAGNNFGYSVLFNSQLGTTVPALTNVPTGALIPAPADPTRTGYLFEGWFTDEAYTDLWDFETDTVTTDLVLYAGWSVDPDYMKSLTFRVPGQPDQIVYLPVDSPISADYAPLGPDGEALSWFTDSAFTDPWDFETGTLTRNLILYGQTPLCTVTFVTGTEETLEAIQLRAGMTLSRPALSRPGYTLCGWYVDEALTTVWDFDAGTLSGDLTLHARWLENEIDQNGQDTGIAIEILNADAIVYTGKPLKPQIVLRDGGKILIEGRDFTLTYRNNTNAADISDDRIKSNKLPQVTIQGKGNYKSTKKITKYFTILPADLANLDITLPTYIATKSGNKNQTLKATVSTGLVKAPAAAYILRYFTDADLTQEVSGITVPGLYYVILQAKTGGNYTGTSDSFPVEAAPGTKLLSSAKLTLGKNLTVLQDLPDSNAALQILIPKVVLDKVTFQTDPENMGAFLSHFVVTATDCDGTSLSQADLGKLLTSPGKKTLHLAAKPGNEANFVGTKDISVQIKGPALNKKQFLVTFDPNAKTTLLKTEFTGSSRIPDVISDLVEGSDYVISYKQGKTDISAEDIRNAGSYTMIITGKNSYGGTLSYNFSIQKADLAKAYAAGRLRIISTGTAVYDPNGAFPHYSLSYTGTDGRIPLENGVDYTLTFSGNKTVTEKATATIKGKGNFTGSLPGTKAQELRFSVTPKPITASDIVLSVTGITMQKTVVKNVKFALTHGGKSIAAAQYKGTFTDNGETVTLTVTGANKLYTGSRSLEIRKDLIPVTDSKRVKITLPKDVKYYYTGSEILPEVTITDSEGRDISHCFLLSYSKNQDVGSGSVTVTGRPDMGYCNTKTVKFTILPRWLQWLLG